jgi:ATP synthase F1 epsilon subunit
MESKKYEGEATMPLQVDVCAPDGWFWENHRADELIIPGSTGFIGILKDHVPVITGVSIDVLDVRQKTTWVRVAVFGGFALVMKNVATILVSAAFLGDDLQEEEERMALEKAETSLNNAEGRKKQIEAMLDFQRAKAKFTATKPRL